MNKNELVSAAAEKANMSKKDTELVLNACVAAVIEALAEGEKVQIAGFGSFEVKNRAARTGRNPRTNEPIDIPASRVPVFKPGKPLRDAVGDSDTAEPA